MLDWRIKFFKFLIDDDDVNDDDDNDNEDELERRICMIEELNGG